MESTISLEAPPSLDAGAYAGPRADAPPTIDSVLQQVETMLAHSYARGESTETWWKNFSAYYRSLGVDPATRISLDIRLGWLFGRYGETTWHGFRRSLETGVEPAGNGESACNGTRSARGVDTPPATICHRILR
jgi:hypothetical protein